MEKNVKFFKTPHSPEVIIATPSTLYILIPFTVDDPGDTCNNGFSIWIIRTPLQWTIHIVIYLPYVFIILVLYEV